MFVDGMFGDRDEDFSKRAAVPVPVLSSELSIRTAIAIEAWNKRMVPETIESTKEFLESIESTKEFLESIEFLKNFRCDEATVHRRFIEAIRRREARAQPGVGVAAGLLRFTGRFLNEEDREILDLTIVDLYRDAWEARRWKVALLWQALRSAIAVFWSSVTQPMQKLLRRVGFRR